MSDKEHYPPRQNEYRVRLKNIPHNELGFKPGQIAIAQPALGEDSTVDIRPDGKLGPTVMNVPEVYVERLTDAEVAMFENNDISVYMASRDQLADKLAYECARLIMVDRVLERSGVGDTLLLYLGIGGPNSPWDDVPSFMRDYELCNGITEASNGQ